MLYPTQRVDITILWSRHPQIVPAKIFFMLSIPSPSFPHTGRLL